MIGLKYTKDFINEKEQEKLLEYINSKPWDKTLQRRTQHYGYKYIYSKLDVEKAEKMPEIFNELIEKLGMKFNQAIVNEYTPGQGISAHTDHEKLFGDTIVSISLGSDVIMDFTRGKEHNMVLLHKGSCVILHGDARYKWKHAIAQRKSDMIEGKRVDRGTRVSITFRNVV